VYCHSCLPPPPRSFLSGRTDGSSFLAEQLPKFEFVSNARPSLFAYQPATKPPEKEVVEKVKTAVLSTTAKTTARAKAKEADQKGDDEMQTVSHRLFLRPISSSRC
jgi:hypothetical protein